MHWKAKVTSSLTDVWLWQQLFGAYHCDVLLFIHSHPWLHENHTIALAPTETDTQKHVDPKGRQ